MPALTEKRVYSYINEVLGTGSVFSIIHFKDNDTYMVSETVKRGSGFESHYRNTYKTLPEYEQYVWDKAKIVV